MTVESVQVHVQAYRHEREGGKQASRGKAIGVCIERRSRVWVLAEGMWVVHNAARGQGELSERGLVGGGEAGESGAWGGAVGSWRAREEAGLGMP